MGVTGSTLAGFETRGAATDYVAHLKRCVGVPPAGAGLDVQTNGVIWTLELLWDPDCRAHKRWAKLCEQVVHGELYADSRLGAAGTEA